MKRFLLLIIAAVFFSCHNERVLQSDYELSNGEVINLGASLQSNENTVLIFLSPECPLCQNYTTTLKALKNNFESEETEFYGVLSGTYYPINQMNGFLIKYDLDLPIILDPDFALANGLDATITPEVVLLDKAGNVEYQGAIDNWAISLGQKRLKITRHYLKEALVARNTGGVIDPKKTEAVGCFIE